MKIVFGVGHVQMLNVLGASLTHIFLGVCGGIISRS